MDVVISSYHFRATTAFPRKVDDRRSFVKLISNPYDIHSNGKLDTQRRRLHIMWDQDKKKKVDAKINSVGCKFFLKILRSVHDTFKPSLMFPYILLEIRWDGIRVLVNLWLFNVTFSGDFMEEPKKLR